MHSPRPFSFFRSAPYDRGLKRGETDEIPFKWELLLWVDERGNKRHIYAATRAPRKPFAPVSAYAAPNSLEECVSLSLHNNNFSTKSSVPAPPSRASSRVSLPADAGSPFPFYLKGGMIMISYRGEHERVRNSPEDGILHYPVDAHVTWNSVC